MFEIITTILAITNGVTLWWAFNKRLPATKQTIALKKAIAAFEVEGQSILSIQKINPENVFLRSPGR